MKPLMKKWRWPVVAAVIALIAFPAPASFIQLTSQRDSSLQPVAGGGDSSQMPIVSADGRYVLFASTANNLTVMSNGAPMPVLTLPSLNVYLRDRACDTTTCHFRQASDDLRQDGEQFDRDEQWRSDARFDHGKHERVPPRWHRQHDHAATLVSVNLAGTGGGNGDSLPVAISTNGRYVLFESAASDLVANDTNNAEDVFVRDLVNGTTALVSVNTNGWSGNGGSRDPAMTPDGRYVVFVSAATDLVSGDTNGIPDVFVRDLQTHTTTLVSVGATPTPVYFSPPNLPGSSESPEITPDGRYVAFYSTATNLVPGVTTTNEIYVRDLVAGNTLWASASANSIFQTVTGGTNEVSCNFSISTNGQYVAFEVCTNPPSGDAPPGIILRYNVQSSLTDVICSNAPVPAESFECIHDLDMTPDGRFVAFVATVGNNSLTNTAIYLWDAQTGSNTLVSPDQITGLPANGICDSPVISTNGRYVAFLSAGTNLVPNPLNGQYHVYLRDLQAGATTLLDVDTNGAGFGVISVTVPSMSSDGSVIAFENGEDNVVANDGNPDSDVFVRELTASSAELVSAHDPSLPSLTPSGGANAFTAGALSANGRYVAFFSDADNVTPGDTNGFRDVFVRDLMAGTIIPVSLNTNGVVGDGISTDPAISGDGRYVAFTSSANDLVAGDTNNTQDVFVRDLQTGITILVSVSTDGIPPGRADFYSPIISMDGRYVLFHSKALNLEQNLFLRDLQAGTTYTLTSGTSDKVVAASMTPDGQTIAFIGVIGASTPELYVWNSQAGALVYTNINTFYQNASMVSISANGQKIAAASSSQLYAVDTVSNTTTVVQSSGTFLPSSVGLQFSGDGHFLTYAMSSNVFTNQNVCLYDFQTQSNQLISQNPNTLQPANGASDSPDLSPDGRFIAYRSAATDLVAGSTNGIPQLIVYDRLVGTNTLLSTAASSTAAGDNRSLTPVFSGDGRTLVFASWASNLALDDFNHFSDIFAFEFLYLNVTLGAPGQGPTLIWPYVSGHSYQVQYKNNLTDNVWQPVSGTMTVNGNQASMIDPAPASGQRFYRVVAQ
jgi:Tol biopolymer transport system component